MLNTDTYLQNGLVQLICHLYHVMLQKSKTPKNYTSIQLIYFIFTFYKANML